MADRNAVIVGAGIGGLAAAIALHRSGWNITVLERAPAVREVGAGISLWPNAIRALDLLGVGDQVREFSTVEGAGERAGDQVTITQDGVRRSVDLLVGADGLRSTVRAFLWPHAKPPVYAGYTTWRLIAPPLELDSEVSESWGRGERVGIFRLADGAIYSYLIANTPPGSEYADDRAELRRRFGRWHDPIPAMLDSVNGSEILRHDIYRLPALRSYVAGRAVLVGDAAHAMTPDLGQGGGTALEDAVELAEALDGDVEHGLHVYDRRRRGRTQTIARQSAVVGTFAQASGRVTVPLRNTAARLLPQRLFLRSVHPMLAWR
jgi:2-polyprenyl-6-methoxyphenol hydroxylase-like FAD-dependent oxidoreductase